MKHDDGWWPSDLAIAIITGVALLIVSLYLHFKGLP